jgi:hypothetical protein
VLAFEPEHPQRESASDAQIAQVVAGFGWIIFFTFVSPLFGCCSSS